MRLLPLALLATLASCSVLLDYQYGIRFEPLPRGPRSDAQSIESVSPREDAVAGVTAVEAPLAIAPDAPMASSIDAHAGLAGLADLTTEAADPSSAHGATSFAAEGAVEPHLEPTPTATLPDADRDEWPTKKPERSMTVAWILWGTVAFLTLFAAGGLGLNFGAHWYYLGQKRKGMRRTVIWALTLVAFSVVYLFSKIAALKLLALLLGIFVLFPLILIQIVGLVKDFFALQKLGTKMARRAKRGPSSNSKKFSI
ncbi:MAG: hypothetical protein RL429_925 [Bacteroidota bacterium]